MAGKQKKGLGTGLGVLFGADEYLSLIHISEPTRP